MGVVAVTELDSLIAAQARDMASNRVWSISLDNLGDHYHTPPRTLANDPRHGTESLYQQRCRCPKCRTAHAAYRQQRRLAGKEPWGP